MEKASQRSSMYRFTVQMATVARAVISQSQELHAGFSLDCRGPSTCCVPGRFPMSLARDGAEKKNI